MHPLTFSPHSQASKLSVSPWLLITALFAYVPSTLKIASINKPHGLSSPRSNPLQFEVDYPGCGSPLPSFPPATRCPDELNRVHLTGQAPVAL